MTLAVSRCTCFVQAAEPGEDVRVLLVTSLGWQKKGSAHCSAGKGAANTRRRAHLKWQRACAQAAFSALNAELVLIKLL